MEHGNGAHKFEDNLITDSWKPRCTLLLGQIDSTALHAHHTSARALHPLLRRHIKVRPPAQSPGLRGRCSRVHLATPVEFILELYHRWVVA